MSGNQASAGYKNKQDLITVLALTVSYLVAEVIGGLVIGSLALLADARHMLTDVGGLALALFTINMTQRQRHQGELMVISALKYGLHLPTPLCS